MADVVVTDPLTLIMRFADVGIATYASLRIVGQPQRTVTWVVEETILLAALAELDAALPDPRDDESPTDALQRALTTGALAAVGSELGLAYRLGVLLMSAAGWDLVRECVSDPRAVLFVAPTARLGRVPWGLLAMPAVRPEVTAMLMARQNAITADGPRPAEIPWPPGEIAELTEGFRLLEFAEVLMAVPANIAHSRRVARSRPDADPLLILDPRVPGQRPDSALGSVLGRPSVDSTVGGHFADLMARRDVLPRTDSVVDLFRRVDADRHWLAEVLAAGPGRLLYVGHASTGADGAERAALHLACRAAIDGHAEPVGDHRPLTAADLMSANLPIPTRVALLACASGGDYRFDEATGIVAAMVLGGAELVTATLWSLPTSAGYRRFVAGAQSDPMGEVIVAVDLAHQAGADMEAARAVNRWQRGQLRRWRAGDTAAAPVYWAAVVSFSVGQAGGTATATTDSSPRR